MRKISTLATALLIGAASLQAQTVATFDTLALTGADTFYVNYSNPGNDVGFDDGLASFECEYDTAWGGVWGGGFAYSSMTDSVNGTFSNIYSAKTSKGYNGSNQYAVVSAFSPVMIRLKGKAVGQPVKGFYATNTTYAYTEMKNGGFGKKFGGVPNTDSDWFKITIKGYLNGSVKTDSIDFYLADFRDADSTKDYIVKTWEWVNLLPLGEVDSISLALSSTDTAGGFGMNNPAFFCIDNFETYETSSVPNAPVAYAAKVYPNPATNVLHIELNDESIKEIIVTGIGGNVVGRFNTTGKINTINTANFTPGIYLVQMVGTNGIAATRFVKQ